MADDFQYWLENLSTNKLEGIRLYYGLYRGTVVRNDDPDKTGRIQAVISNTGQTLNSDIWIYPSFLLAGANHGSSFIPEEGDSVWIVFEVGDASKPLCYFPGWYGSPNEVSEVPTELSYGTKYPDRKGFVFRMGHSFVFDETLGDEKISLTWHQPISTDVANSDRTKTADRTKGKFARLLFSKTGVELSGFNNNKIVINDVTDTISISDNNSNSITMGKDGITIKSNKTITLDGTTIKLSSSKISLGKGAQVPVVKTAQLLTWLRFHTHLVVATPNPTGVPIPTLPPTIPPPNTIGSGVTTTS